MKKVQSPNRGMECRGSFVADEAMIHGSCEDEFYKALLHPDLPASASG